jgi:sodium transport system permease protein
MRFSIIQTIFRKELLDMSRDRRTLISMVAVPVLVIPLLLQVVTRVTTRMEQKSEDEVKTMGIAARVTTPSIREALEKTGLQIADKDDLKDAVEKKVVAAAVEEIPGTPIELRIYVDSSNPTSSAGADKIRTALNDLKDRQVREGLRNSGIPESVLTPFIVKRTNIAGQRKMAGAIWGSILGYILLLMMFTGGMYPVIDMTAGEKERKTLEALLASPAARREIVMGKTLAAITAIFLTATLTLSSMVYSLRGSSMSGRNAEMKQIMDTVPLDPHTVSLIALTLIPLSIFAASVMFAIALFARSFKEGQSYLTPLALIVVFPALLGGLPGLGLTPVLCLIPIFNASMVIRGILLGDVSMVNFGVTLAANLIYAAVAFTMATRTFERESVLFRS